MADDADPDVEKRAEERVHFAVLTPIGRGAIATVAVRGGHAANLVSRRFTSASGKALAEFPAGRVVFGRFRTAADCAEELVVGLAAPERVEIHCHGGPAAVAAICEALTAEGGIQVEPAEWLQHEITNPLAAEALLALSQARTERTAAVLLDQYRGALVPELERIEQWIITGDQRAAAQAIAALVGRAAVGLHLTKPWRIAIAGRPNAGKSSLMNALVGYERAIVFAEPGTTRDVVTASTAIDGWPIDLYDTAGLRQSREAIEAEGVARAEQQIAAADLVLLVSDLTGPWDGELAGRVNELLISQQSATQSPTQSPRLLIVHNKRDLASQPADDRPPGLLISARTGEGIDSLCQAIVHTLVPIPPPPGALVPFQPRHVSGLTTAAGHLDVGNVDLARQALQGVILSVARSAISR
jgi:tRNA modification GTPase